MNFKISQIPPLSGSLNKPDLLELSKYTGGGYTSRSVAVSSFMNDLFVYVREDVNITSGHILSGGFELSFDPRTDETISLNIVNGPPTVRGFDWELTAPDFITWTGYALDTEVSIGDIFSVNYIKY